MKDWDKLDDCSLHVSLEKDLLLWLSGKHAQTYTQLCRDKTIGTMSGKMSFSLWLWDHCVPQHWRFVRQVPVWAWPLQLWLQIQQYHQCPIVSLCFENAVVTSKQWQNSEQTVKALLPLEQHLHLEAKMGQSQTRPTQVPTVQAMPPCPRMVCTLRLGEPPQRFCCPYQHFSYPERTMSYSPPYSPSLFKRPDRR